MPASLRQSDAGPNLWIGDDVTLGEDVEIGVNVVIHSGTVVDEGVRILDGAVLGKRPAPSPHSSAPRNVAEPLRVAAGATIGSTAILFAGATIGPNAILGDQSFVRELATVGAHTVVAGAARSASAPRSASGCAFRRTYGSRTEPWSRTTSSSVQARWPSTTTPRPACR